jgi:hypothetical protein
MVLTDCDPDRRCGLGVHVDSAAGIGAVKHFEFGASLSTKTGSSSCRGSRPDGRVNDTALAASTLRLTAEASACPAPADLYIVHLPA